jgi:hypothetical protein
MAVASSLNQEEVKWFTSLPESLNRKTVVRMEVFLESHREA